jgi:phage shock protein PspC (stress-responsive transcriptional regulator)
MEKKLYRDEYRKKIGGVCAGLAEYFDIDVAIVRALFVITFFAGGSSFLAYFVLWIVVPTKSAAYFNPTVDYRVPPQQPFNPFEDKGTVNQGQPFVPLTPKKTSTPAGIIFGCILIFFGAVFLFHELGIFRFWHVARLWPVILVVGGLAMIVSGQKKQPWEKEGWQNTAAEPEVNATEQPLSTEEKKDDNFNNTPPTV